MEGKCGLKGVVYQATVKYDGGKSDTYVGLTERKLSDRVNEHYRSFEDYKSKSSTKLSKKIWNLKDQDKNYELKWKILRSAKPYSSGTTECGLCLTEVKCSISVDTRTNSNCQNSKSSNNFNIYNSIFYVFLYL